MDRYRGILSPTAGNLCQPACYRCPLSSNALASWISVGRVIDNHARHVTSCDDGSVTCDRAISRAPKSFVGGGRP
ncbi:uncharacterized protein LAESUDRAFT_494949 [Laetiporus sulphureus 93-53]|uniref:Uncharacterized protein n=1 Tax=Laetiporus sulphureus 93-53 TaxID=1314785 RepID=A0A165BHW4_9APHY|nr:uncharacterized protein LAESUDRAFT_494949 [Laetiporus sulphureus 93-53]KZT01089.1 hypothetical protein LAESUDRAFT_494949 [Laetiporus sulphureus 93-53]